MGRISYRRIRNLRFSEQAEAAAAADQKRPEGRWVTCAFPHRRPLEAKTMMGSAPAAAQGAAAGAAGKADEEAAVKINWPNLLGRWKSAAPVGDQAINSSTFLAG